MDKGASSQAEMLDLGMNYPSAVRGKERRMGRSGQVEQVWVERFEVFNAGLRGLHSEQVTTVNPSCISLGTPCMHLGPQCLSQSHDWTESPREPATVRAPPGLQEDI